jgi:cell cycle arrest protein BUB3
MEYPLAPAPSDGISSIKFSRSSNLLLVSSWDQSVRLYDAQQNQLRARFDGASPVLDCCFSDDSKGFSGGLDRAVKMHELNTQTESVLGYHDQGVRCVEFADATGQLVTGGWDSAVKLWDPRSQTQAALTHTAMQPGKILTMAVSENRLIVGTHGRYVQIWDLRKMAEPEQRRESSLKYQTRAIRCSPDREGYVLSSVEGRVAVEYFDQRAEAQAKKYAFKCHRSSAAGKETIFPVNAIAFHPVYGTFATGGCDGVVNVWDGANKKRLSQLRQFPTSIAALDYNHDGSLLAVACSYTFEEGEKDHPEDSIFVKVVADSDVKPKPKK